MNLFFNKYIIKVNAKLNDSIVTKSGFLSVGQKGTSGYILYTDKNGRIIWEKDLVYSSKGFKLIHISEINQDQFYILGNASTAEKNEQSHILIKFNLQGQFISTIEIHTETLQKSIKLTKTKSDEWLISGWKNINNSLHTEYIKINSNGQIIKSANLITKDEIRHKDVITIDQLSLFVGANKQSNQGVILFSDTKSSIHKTFYLFHPDLNEKVELGALTAISKDEILLSGNSKSDIFITKAKILNGNMTLSPLRFGFLNATLNVLKIIYRDPYAYVLGFDTIRSHHFVIKFDTNISDINKSKVWTKYIGASKIAHLLDIEINDAGFILSGYISEKDKKSELPILISTNESIESCTTEMGSKDTKDIKPVILQITEADLKDSTFTPRISNVTLVVTDLDSQVIEICPPEEEPKQKCPFAMTAWNTIEPRARTLDYSKGLRAEVRDAMWMLSRQWQWGEFDGEDGGSIVYSKVGFVTTKLNRYTQLVDSPQYEAYVDSMPLEYKVERSSIDLESNWLLRMEVGNYWAKLLSKAQLGNLISGFINSYPVKIPKDPTQETIPEMGYEEYLQLKNNEETWLMLVSASNKSIDGLQFINAIKEGTHFTHTFLSGINLDDVLDKFKSKYYDLLHVDSDISSWSSMQLEHNFQCKAKNTNANQSDFKIMGSEYSGKNLDWHDMDIKTGGKDYQDKSDENFEVYAPISDKKILIPSKIFFPGMPESRWWQMEEGQVDFGNMIVNKTDISKLLLLDFMLNYAGNWYMLPHVAEVGTLTEIYGIEVRDNFGIRTLIQAANQQDPPLNDESKWSVFQLENESNSSFIPESLLFLAPTTPDKLEGKPLEKVNFIRDEIANMVWGIEQTINSGMNKGTDGGEAGFKLRQALTTFNENNSENNVPTTTDEQDANKLKYRLMTSVPENWIPFIPVNTDSTHRSIKLQRAKTLRAIPNFSGPVSPRTNILKKVQPKYFINEEEVPKAGRIIEGKWQRARWFDGRTFLWYGHEKKIGRGGGTSGLKFDQLEYDKK